MDFLAGLEVAGVRPPSERTLALWLDVSGPLAIILMAGAAGAAVLIVAAWDAELSPYQLDK
jgi:hypothetical protein